MRFRCILSFRTAGAKKVATWRTDVRQDDLVLATANAIQKLKRRQRRPLTVVGIYVQLVEAAGKT